LLAERRAQSIELVQSQGHDGDVPDFASGLALQAPARS
jgi:hypothetical protein